MKVNSCAGDGLVESVVEIMFAGGFVFVLVEASI